MSDTILAIAATEAKSAAEGANGDAETKVKAAMGVTVRHWLAPDEDTAFRAAVAGAFETLEPDDQEAVRRSLEFLRALSAAASGVPVNFEALLPEEGETPPKTLPLSKWWNEVKSAKEPQRMNEGD